MKVKMLMSLIGISLFGLNVAAAQVNVDPTLTVNISNLSDNNGVVRIALFNSAVSFENTSDGASAAVAKAALPISNNTATWTVNVPYGTYAIKAFHDEDNSGQLKRSLFGIPQEDYGFSNMTPSSSGKPTFEEAAFNFSASNNSINIQMKQP